MIRKLKVEDNDTIINIWHEASSLAHPFLKNDFTEKVKTDLQDIYLPKCKTWVFEENDTLIGFISMLGNEIGGLFVLPNNHLKGVGTQLVNFVGKLYKEIEVEVFEKNVIGRAFYEKYGFIEIKTYYHTESKNNMIRMYYKNK